jgi:hypothetical protein
MAFLLLFLRWWLLGGALLWLGCVLTRGIRLAWLKHLIRSLVAAFAFTPTIASLAGTTGFWPLPAGWVLLCSIGEKDPLELYSNLFWGGLPICVVACGIWLTLLRMTPAVRKTL